MDGWDGLSEHLQNVSTLGDVADGPLTQSSARESEDVAVCLCVFMGCLRVRKLKKFIPSTLPSTTTTTSFPYLFHPHPTTPLTLHHPYLSTTFSFHPLHHQLTTSTISSPPPPSLHHLHHHFTTSTITSPPPPSSHHPHHHFTTSTITSPSPSSSHHLHQPSRFVLEPGQHIFYLVIRHKSDVARVGDCQKLPVVEKSPPGLEEAVERW